MIVINATDTILGRLASYAAKQALAGETVRIVNCERAVISGDKKVSLEKYKQRRARGTPTTGPYHSRLPDRMVRRAVRGMLPYKKKHGRDAYQRVLCYLGVPEELKKEKLIPLPGATISKLPNRKFITLKSLAKGLGANLE